MALKPVSKRMSAEDAFFLYFERPHAPLHVASLGIFEGTIPIAKARDGLAARLHLIPRYRQRPVFPPLLAGYPSWEDDPDFALERHVRLLELPKPVTDATLHKVCAEIFAEPLPRDRPLWEMVVIQGLQGDRTAYVTKVHHCLVDGVSGVELTLVLLDVSPSPPPPPPADAWEPKPTPTPAGAWLEGIVDQVANGLISITEWQRDLLDPREGLRLIAELATAGRQAVSAAMQWPEPAPWNRRVGKDRRTAFVKMPFHEVRAIRAALGGTVNDVVLTILGGALGRYLQSHGAVAEDKRLRLMIPVNVRTEQQRGTMGNRVSMMLPQVPVGISDPIARLNAIRSEMDALKSSDQGAAFDRLLGLVENGPAALSAIAGRVGLLPGMINLACTNVPGPLIPLYGTGHRMLDFYPLIPLAGDLGLGVAIMSYDQSLHWGLVCDPTIVPDVERIADLISEEFRSLRDAAGVSAIDLPEAIGLHQPVPVPRPTEPEARRKPSPARTAATRKTGAKQVAPGPAAANGQSGAAASTAKSRNTSQRSLPTQAAAPNGRRRAAPVKIAAKKQTTKRTDGSARPKAAAKSSNRRPKAAANRSRSKKATEKPSQARRRTAAQVKTAASSR
jgi:WS/DGAT/MGAT family acyltransferase